MNISDIKDTLKEIHTAKDNTLELFIQNRLDKSLLSYQYDVNKIIEELNHKNSFTVLNRYNKGRYEKYRN